MITATMVITYIIVMTIVMPSQFIQGTVTAALILIVMTMLTLNEMMTVITVMAVMTEVTVMSVTRVGHSLLIQNTEVTVTL